LLQRLDGRLGAGLLLVILRPENLLGIIREIELELIVRGRGDIEFMRHDAATPLRQPRPGRPHGTSLECFQQKWQRFCGSETRQNQDLASGMGAEGKPSMADRYDPGRGRDRYGRGPVA